MSWAIVFLFALPAAFADAPIDKNCTDGTNYAPNAVSCTNPAGDAVCLQVWGAGTASTVVVGKNAERTQTCWSTDGKAVDADLVNSAIANCPSFCGYCCLTKDWNCQNTQYPRIPCDSITPPMCNDPASRDVIAQDCPNKCGFCQMGGCVDIATTCAISPSICLVKGLEDFVGTNCKRTCGLCGAATSAPVPSATVNQCAGTTNHPNCANWVANGFCGPNSGYTTQEKMSYCCSFCFPSGK